MSLIRLHQSSDDTQAYYPFLYPVTATLLTNVLNTLREQCDECEGGSNAEVYDPLAGTFIATGKMTALRRGHTATLLADGTVLIAGGDAALSAEIYDPFAGIFNSTGKMNAIRRGHTATLLPDGTVLIAGAGPDLPDGAASAEIYHPLVDSSHIVGNP